MRLALPWQSDSDVDLLYRLYYATDGVIANIMNLMRGASRLARKRGTDRLETDILATVFDKRLAKHLNKAINPFRVSPDTQFASPQGSAPAPAASFGNKNQDKKGNQPSIAETLSVR